MKHRNYELAPVAKNDPTRLRTRTVSPEKEKQIKNRSRRKASWRITIKNRGSKSKSGGGIGLGMILAVILSWMVNHSVFWAILHFFCSWFYVIYWVFAY